MTTIDQIGSGLRAVRKQQPLVHSISNYVGMNLCANALLALGAAPVMAHAIEEVEEVTAAAQALVLDIATLSTPFIEAMFRAGQVARERTIPVVLDPAGAGSTQLRSATARRLLNEIAPDIVRGNSAEIIALESDTEGGVGEVDPVATARAAAVSLAQRQGCVVAVTGDEDFVTDGQRHCQIRNGHHLLKTLAGSGATASAIVGALAAVEPDRYRATVAGLLIFSIAGEVAAIDHPLPGTFQVLLLDTLAALDEHDLRRGAKLSERRA